MDLKNLTSFIQVAELRNFTKAAERLGYSQSTVSFQIKQLEEELGVKLFERINHTVKLTSDGMRLLQCANEIEGILMDFNHTEEEPAGVVRMATADSLCVATVGQIFSKLRSKHPGVTLKITTAGTQALFRLIDQNEADLLYTLDSPIRGADYVIVQEQRIPARFVASPKHPLAERNSITPEELLHYPLLLTEKGMSYRRLLDEEFAQCSLPVQPALESSNTDLLCNLAEQGEGVAFLPEFAFRKSVKKGKLVELNVERIQVEIWAQLLYHRDKWMSTALRVVIDELKRCVL